MNRAEFDQAVAGVLPKGKEAPGITEQDYKTIEYVYTFHPSISETEGKKQIAELYVHFGMALIKDMVPRAKLMDQKESELRAAREALRKVEEEIREIRAGGEI